VRHPLLARALTFTLLAAAVSGLGCNTEPAASNQPSAPASPPGPAQGRLVEITAGDTGFTPATVPAKKGETITLRFTRTTKSECLKAIEISELGIKKDLPLNTPVDVVIKPEKEGDLVFECWMKMLGGKVVVSAS
jgi:plastocyanin domain-containing protein